MCCDVKVKKFDVGIHIKINPQGTQHEDSWESELQSDRQNMDEDNANHGWASYDHILDSDFEYYSNHAIYTEEEFKGN